MFTSKEIGELLREKQFTHLREVKFQRVDRNAQVKVTLGKDKAYSNAFVFKNMNKSIIVIIHEDIVREIVIAEQFKELEEKIEKFFEEIYKFYEKCLKMNRGRR